MAMRRCRGIMGQTSWRTPELVSSCRDRGCNGAHHQLLIVGSRQLCDVGSLGRDFNGNRGSGDVIQWPEGRSQVAHRNLPPLQLTGDRDGGGLAKRQRRALRGGPEAKRALIVLSIRQQRGVDPHATPEGRRVQCDVDGCVIGIGENRALIDRKVRIRVAQNQSADASAFEFLAQAVG